MRILSSSEARSILSSPHCFSYLNFTCKESSTSQKIRPAVTNTSSNHPSGSINSRLPTGPNLINNLKTVQENFRIQQYVAMADLMLCYRSMITCEKSNAMRLMSYPADPLDACNDEFMVLMLSRAEWRCGM